MHPAPSIIIFTVLSGVGFGMFAYIGFDFKPIRGLEVLPYVLIAFSLSVVGLLSSLFHLGNPHRAWRALSQWRTSWLSREGVLAIISLVLCFCLSLSLVLSVNHSQLLGYLAALFSILTVFSTAMIYAQMKAVPRWNNFIVPSKFIIFSLTCGALLMSDYTLSVLGLVASVFLQILFWLIGDQSLKKSPTNILTSTGNLNLGEVTLLESPHTGSNYLMKEMFYVLARKHAQKLRFITICFMCIFPFISVYLTFFIDFIFVLATSSYIIGIFLSRWLFFAEAEHVVSFYYGRT